MANYNDMYYLATHVEVPYAFVKGLFFSVSVIYSDVSTIFPGIDFFIDSILSFSFALLIIILILKVPYMHGLLLSPSLNFFSRLISFLCNFYINIIFFIYTRTRIYTLNTHCIYI